MKSVHAPSVRNTHTAVKRLCMVTLLAGLSLSLSGCASLAITALGVGASMGINHTVNGTASRTFTMPLPEIRKAAFAALKRMDFAIDGTKKVDSGETIAARAPERDIQVHLEVISANTTRMRTSARNGMLMDAATANEIIAQTERSFKRI